LGLSESSISAYRYVSLRFSRIRILQKKWSNFVGSRLNFPSRLAFFCRENSATLTSLIPTEISKYQKGSIRPLRKKRLALRKDEALVTTSENRWELRGVTCPFAVDQLSLWDQALSACFPFFRFSRNPTKGGL